MADKFFKIPNTKPELKVALDFVYWRSSSGFKYLRKNLPKIMT